MGMNYERVLRAGRVFRKCQLNSKAELGVFENSEFFYFTNAPPALRMVAVKVCFWV